MDEELKEFLARLLQAGTVSDGDVMLLRDSIWSDEGVAQPIVDALFSLNNRLDDYSPVWADFFIETVGYFVLDQSDPKGLVSEANAQWLLSQIDKNGRVASLVELELLVSLIEHAETVPDRLTVYALGQAEAVIMTGDGPTRKGQICVPNRVDAPEVEMLRRLIFAGGGEGATIVGSTEADLLFRIKDATLNSDNAPSWQLLFVQGVGNHLMAHSDYRPLSADDAARFNRSLDQDVPHLGRFLKRILPATMIGSGTITEAFKSLFPRTEDRFAKSLAIDNSHLITTEEAGWLKDHIAADGQIDDFEKALLTFVFDEAESVPSSLETFRKRA